MNSNNWCTAKSNFHTSKSTELKHQNIYLFINILFEFLSLTIHHDSADSDWNCVCILSGQNQRVAITDNWKNFDEFKKYRNGVWEICIDPRKCNEFPLYCSCPSFLKHLACKHVLDMLIRLELCDVAPQARSIPLGQTQTRSPYSGWESSHYTIISYSNYAFMYSVQNYLLLEIRYFPSLFIIFMGCSAFFFTVD